MVLTAKSMAKLLGQHSGTAWAGQPFNFSIQNGKLRVKQKDALKNSSLLDLLSSALEC